MINVEMKQKLVYFGNWKNDVISYYFLLFTNIILFIKISITCIYMNDYICLLI